jgi:hypothetical protein
VPDGALDALFSWLPAMRAKRQLWERGQQLWTEQMTAALSGPCEECRASGLAMAPGAGLSEPGPAGPGPSPGVAPLPYEVAESSTMMMSTPAPPMPDMPEDARTAAMPAFQEPPEIADLPTSAAGVPSFGARVGRTAPPEQPAASGAGPAPGSDEHESHTVILSSLPSLRTTSRLVVLDGPVHGRQFSLGRQLTTIGRSIGCHITVEADTVAYDHARVVRTPSGFQIEPLGSAGELYVNDEPVREARALHHGDVIRIGPARLRFESTSQAE